MYIGRTQKCSFLGIYYTPASLANANMYHWNPSHQIFSCMIVPGFERDTSSLKLHLNIGVSLAKWLAEYCRAKDMGLGQNDHIAHGWSGGKAPFSSVLRGEGKSPKLRRKETHKAWEEECKCETYTGTNPKTNPERNPTRKCSYSCVKVPNGGRHCPKQRKTKSQTEEHTAWEKSNWGKYERNPTGKCSCSNSWEIVPNGGRHCPKLRKTEKQLYSRNQCTFGSFVLTRC